VSRPLAALAGLFLLSCGTPSVRPAGRPNIVLILADDLGYSDLGCYGGEIRTPNLDRLAARGLRFTQFYNAARCCPTRASLLTGLHPHQAGIGHMVEDRGLPGYRGRLNDRCVTIAEVLRSAGYRTYLSGKWHVGQARPQWPADRGFDRSFALISGGTNYFELERGRIMARDGEPYAPPAGNLGYLTDTFTDHALRFLEEAGREPAPFFLYLAYTAPHWPLQARPEDLARTRGRYAAGWDAAREARLRRMADLGLVDPRWALAPRDPRVPPWEEAKDRELQELKMAVYAAMVERMDEGIGRVVAQLDRMGAADRTLVLFLSDNGASAEEYDRVTPAVPPGPRESFHTCGPPWANVSNTPFRSYKHWVHEGGISTPLIACGPPVAAAGGATREPGHLVDLMATLVEVAGAEYPRTFAGRDVLPMEGRSLVPVLRGGSLGERTLAWEHEGNRAIRKGSWKLVARHGSPWELYDLDADRTENHDLAARHPERVAVLSRAWEAWAARCGVEPWSRVMPGK
jgi:arylsulfatase